MVANIWSQDIALVAHDFKDQGITVVANIWGQDIALVANDFID